ncbi:MAG: NAD(P)/FAD-dependent oxidoreductase [Rhizomicrobium sp.]
MACDVDCLIIGGGPAGLTAATYLGRFRRNVLLVDGGESRASWIPVTHNVLGFSRGITGPQLLNSLRRQADQYGTRRMAGQVTKLKLEPDGRFHATWEQGQVCAATVLLATGGLDVEPGIEDARAAVKAGLMRHCPICDAYEATGKKIALVAYGKCRTKEALLLRGYTSDLTVLTLGHAAQLATEDVEILTKAGIEIVLRPVGGLTREGDHIAAWPSDGSAPLMFDTIYSALGMDLRSGLAMSLGAEVDEDGALLVDRHQQTSVAGLYAAGDVVHGLSQVSVAAGQAAIAATAINANLPALRY